MAATITAAVLDSSKLRGRDRRTQNLSTKLTPNEENELKTASADEGKNLSEWAREVLLRAARRHGANSAPESIALIEIVGIQLLLMNLLSPLLRGEHISAEQYQNIIKTVQTSKIRVTHELLAKRLNAQEQ